MTPDCRFTRRLEGLNLQAETSEPEDAHRQPLRDARLFMRALVAVPQLRSKFLAWRGFS